MLLQCRAEAGRCNGIEAEREKKPGYEETMRRTRREAGGVRGRMK